MVDPLTNAKGSDLLLVGVTLRCVSFVPNNNETTQ